MNYNEDLMNIFNNTYNELDRTEQIKLLHKYFPVGIKISLYYSLSNNSFIKLEGNTYETTVLGYDLDSVDYNGDKYVPGLIIENISEDTTFLINHKSIHPAYATYNSDELRNFSIDKLLTIRTTK